MLILSLSLSLSFCGKYKDYPIGEIIPQTWINRLYVHLTVLDFFTFFSFKKNVQGQITSKLETTWLAPVK